MSALSHPLPRGTRVATLTGEVDLDCEDAERTTPPGAIGRITGVASERSDGSEGFCYDLIFDNEAWVIVDDRDLDDSARYRVLPAEG